jgi:hypothetical protein
MIDQATGWFEKEQIENKTAAEAAAEDICKTTWFTPQRITLDQGAELMVEFAKMVKIIVA